MFRNPQVETFSSSLGLSRKSGLREVAVLLGKRSTCTVLLSRLCSGRCERRGFEVCCNSGTDAFALESAPPR